MGATAAVTSVRTAESSHFVPQKMFTASTAMSRSTKNPYLVNKIAFLHKIFCGKSKITSIIAYSSGSAI